MCACRTQFSGIRPEDIEKGDSFENVKKDVVEIVRNKIVVGHSIEYDFDSLKINPAGTVYILGQFWTGTKCFGRVQIVLVGSKSFWLSSN